ncbi:cytochrome c biogenesis CcdA family protein [Deinococcus sp. QL22]|uniref:cytochrome c biogenesis CcdA family protein n=1 Tax=Deinococcus sp. QL22 TaxID=2939437 RepID=UPI002016C3D1|nr:cytochrome c biogenesis CcdA family protein [Deinococcus sp. QL22]UQN07168.1 cytochrome c biogenesis CcdA family protein [Deinococcus sp. QL22]
MLLLLIAFVGGVLTVISPCVLPVLPVLLSGTVGGRARPAGIIVGFVGSFVVLTLFLSTLVSALNLSPDALRWGAVALLFIFGLTLAVPALQLRFEVLAARVMPQNVATGNSKGGDGFGGGLLVGLTLGLVWTPCVGPILASVTTLALSGQVTAFAVAMTLAYALGVALPMLAIMRGGRAMLKRVPALMGNLSRIQQTFGVVLAVFAVGMAFGLDRAAQTFIVERVPYVQRLTFLEETDSVRQQLQQQAP